MSEWIESTVGQVTKTKRAGGTPTATNGEYYGGEIPFVIIEDITNSSRYLEQTVKFLTEKGLRNSAAWLITKPHVLYSMYATVGIPVINKINCATNQAIIALEEAEDIEQLFLYYQLLYIRPQVYKYTAQTTQSNLNAKTVNNLVISYPKNKKIQQKIIRVLTSIDTSIEKTEALIHKYQQIKAGLMHDLFTRGVTADGKLRPPREQASELYQETTIGWIPKEWDVNPLKSIYKNPIRDFGSFSSTNLINFLDDGVFFIKSEMIKEEEIDWKNVYFVSTEVHQFLSKSHVEKGQILFSKIGSALGKAVLYEGERGVCNSNAAIAKIEVDEQLVLPRYVEVFLNSRFAKEQFELMVISLLPRINLGDINKLFIQLPPTSEQKRICEKYSSLKTTINAELEYLRKLQKQKSGLMHDLLTGKVPVTIDQAETAHV